MSEQEAKAKSPDDGLIIGRITDKDVENMRRRIGFPNPTLRKGILQTPWNTALNPDAVRRYAECIGDLNPLYNNEDYAKATRWGEVVAPPGFEWSMGIDRNPEMDEQFVKETRSALRGVQLFHSGAEYFYYRPFTEGVKIYKSEVVGSVEEKTSRFGGKSVIVDNVTNWWDGEDRVYVTSHRWFVHTERKAVKKDDAEGGEKKKEKKLVELGNYSDEDLAKIEAAYDAEYIRGADTLWYEDVEVGADLPTMVKGPLTITDMINYHMGGLDHLRKSPVPNGVREPQEAARVLYEERIRRMGHAPADPLGRGSRPQGRRTVQLRHRADALQLGLPLSHQLWWR